MISVMRYYNSLLIVLRNVNWEPIAAIVRATSDWRAAGFRALVEDVHWNQTLLASVFTWNILETISHNSAELIFCKL